MDNNKSLYDVFEYIIDNKNFDITINKEREEIVGILCKFYDENDNIIELNQYDSFLSVSKIISGDLINYCMPETVDLDITYYTEHVQLKNGLEKDPNLIIYFLNCPSKHEIELEFKLDISNQKSKIYMYIVVLKKIINITKNEEYIYFNAKNDFSNGLTSEDKPFINWICKK